VSEVALDILISDWGNAATNAFSEQIEQKMQFMCVSVVDKLSGSSATRKLNITLASADTRFASKKAEALTRFKETQSAAMKNEQEMSKLMDMVASLQKR